MPNIQQPPRAKKVEHITEMHSHTLIDNYRWIKTEGLQSPDVQQLITAENAYADSILSRTKALKDKIFLEMLDRKFIDPNPTEEDKPSEIEYTQIGDWFYGTVKTKNEMYSRYYRKKESDDTEELIIDINEFVKQFEYCNVLDVSFSSDRSFLLIHTNLDSRSSKAFIFDVNSKRISEALTCSDVCFFLRETNYLIYHGIDNEGIQRRVMKHLAGTPVENDDIIYQENAVDFSVCLITITGSGRYLVWESCNFYTNEWWILDLENPDKGIFCLLKRSTVVDESYWLEHSGDYFYIMGNHGGAYNFKIIRVPIDNIGNENRQEIVAHNKTVSLGVSPDNGVNHYGLKNYFVYLEHDNGKQKIKYICNSTGEIKEIQLDIALPFFEIELDGGDYDGDVLEFSVCSIAMPYKCYTCDLATGEVKVTWEQEIKNFQQELYEHKLLWATARDGELVPISAVYRKDLFKQDGSNPLYFDSYGGYGNRDPQYFDVNRLPMLDRGFVYAEAHIRGSGFKGGYPWHFAGKRMNKLNRFNDLIDCTEFLIKEKYTSLGLIAAFGRSAGGENMTYLANVRPDLYKVIITEVPSVDDLNEFIDKDNSTFQAEISEAGSAKLLENKTEFDYFLSYTQYHNVSKHDYPHILVFCGLRDHTNTGYWGATKWIQKIRELKSDSNEQVVVIENAGHRGRQVEYEHQHTRATELAFILEKIVVTV